MGCFATAPRDAVAEKKNAVAETVNSSSQICTAKILHKECSKVGPRNDNPLQTSAFPSVIVLGVIVRIVTLVIDLFVRATTKEMRVCWRYVSNVI